jgi:hypothetical protein
VTFPICTAPALHLATLLLTSVPSHGFNGNLVGMGLGTFLCADVEQDPLVALHNILFVAGVACCPTEIKRERHHCMHV